MAKFCSTCNTKLSEDSPICTTCGQPTDTAIITDPNQREDNGTAVKSVPNYRVIIGLAIVLSIIVVIVALITSLSGDSTGYHGVVTKYFKAIKDKNGSVLIETYPKNLVENTKKNLYQTGFDTVNEYYATEAKGIKKEYEDELGKIKSISYKITNTDRLTNNEIKFVEGFVINADTGNKVNVSKGYNLDLGVKIKGSDKSSTIKYKAVVFKADGDWCILNIERDE
ncbi:MAG: zinc ribbon domain-containing protein [Clostridiales bacterium]|nr:zinc ribbon domain-containing protein [Clostridiales bacterium]